MTDLELTAHLSTLAKIGTTNAVAICQLVDLAEHGIITLDQKAEFVAKILAA